MDGKPVAAGKSSLDLIDRDIAFTHIITTPDARYLDLACGTGRYTLELARRIDGKGLIYSIDLWEEGIDALKEAAKECGFNNVEPIVGDITEALPLEDESVDVCFIATALHDLPEEKRAGLIREVKRVLSPGGIFVLIEFKKFDHGPGPSREKRIDETDAVNLLSPYGFANDTVVDLGEFPYLTRFIKQ